jgi:hypothetical protein
MKVFIVYDSTGFVWYRGHTSFQSAVDVVSLYVKEWNRCARVEGFYTNEEECPVKMEEECTYKDEQSGIMVAHNEIEKISIFIKEITI